MAIQGDLVGRYITGADIIVKSCNVVIHQPTVREILQIGEDDFLLGVQFLTKTNELFKELREGNSELSNLSDFQILLIMYTNDIDLRTKLDLFFELVFPSYEILLTDTSIDFQDKESKIIRGRVTPFNFTDLQETLENLFIPYSQKKEDYNPANDAAAAIAKKIKEGQAKRAQKTSKAPQSLLGSFCSILSVGLRLDINILLSYTMFQLFDTYMRFEKKQAEDQYIRIATVPFADTSNIEQPDSWVDNLYD